MNPSLNVYAFDQLNMDRSGGPFRGEIASLDDSVRQLDTFYDYLKVKHPKKPKVFLAGASYGGTMAFKSAILHP